MFILETELQATVTATATAAEPLAAAQQQQRNHPGASQSQRFGINQQVKQSGRTPVCLGT